MGQRRRPRYEWNHFEVDLRCPRCGSPGNDPYMVTDELWASSGLESDECFRCSRRRSADNSFPSISSEDCPPTTVTITVPNCGSALVAAVRTQRTEKNP